MGDQEKSLSLQPPIPFAKGPLVHITAIFGFTLAGLVIQNESRVFLKD